MKRMKWNYRVVKKDNQFTIHGVYYDEKSNIVSLDNDPNYPFGEDLEELEDRLKLMQDSLKKAIIDFETPTEIK
jgi:hypothetical protein